MQQGRLGNEWLAESDLEGIAMEEAGEAISVVGRHNFFGWFE